MTRLGKTTQGTNKHLVAVGAVHNRLGVRKHGGTRQHVRIRKRRTHTIKNSHLKATGALDVHEEAVGALNETLELVVSGFGSSVGVKQILFNLT